MGGSVKFLATLAALLIPASAALGVPTISDPSLSPTSWRATNTAAVSWLQTDFNGQGLGPAVVEVNTAADGSATGSWLARHTIPAPLTDGANVAVIHVADLEGEHLVRMVIAGAAGSPLGLGSLRLDRSAPAPSAIRVAHDSGDGNGSVSFTLDDAGRAGVAPFAPVTVEYQAAGAWHPASSQPSTGQGAKVASLPSAGLAEGAYPLRVTATDVLGNTAPRPLGTLLVDRTSPVVSNLRIARPPSPTDPTAEIAYRAVDPAGGSGLDPAVSAQAVLLPLGQHLTSGPNTETGTFVVSLPGPGSFPIAVEVTDRVGRVGRGSITIDVPMPPPSLAARAAPVAQGVDRIEALVLRAPRQAPNAGARWAYALTTRFHARRGVKLSATLAAARTPADWTHLLGTSDANRIDGYATFGGVVAVGPTVSRGLDDLQRVRLCTRVCAPPTRAEANRIAAALAVLLHESIHASGATAEADVVETASGRAFEEAFAEAATIDLLPDLIRQAPLRASLRASLVAAAGRYRAHYPAQVDWARTLSATATGTDASSPTAKAWRVDVADTWGADRWSRLAAATGYTESDLRAAAPPVAGQPLR